MIIDELFERLHSLPNTNDARELMRGPNSEVLSVLAYTFPNRFVPAIDHIMRRRCKKYTHDDVSMIMVDRYIVATKLWACPCDDFLEQLNNSTVREKWKPVCSHLLAAHIIQNEYPIYEKSLVLEKELNLDEYIDLALRRYHNRAA